MKNLGLITYGLDRSPGGIGRYTEELLAGLRRASAPVTVLHAGRAAEADGAISLPGARLLPGLLTLGQVEVAWVARQRHLALVHDPTGSAPLLLTSARRVATIHDAIPYRCPDTSTLLDRLIYRIWLKRVAPRLDAVITPSQSSRVDILHHLPIPPERVHVIPEAVGQPYRPLSQTEVIPAVERHGVDGPYILYVGSVQARKNLVRLLEAYAQLRDSFPRWQLVVVGARKWKFGPVFETVRRLGLDSNVRFTGFVPESDLPALYSGADLFVFPSLYEGFGLPVLEAMACGTPVITSTSSSLPEVAGDAAVLVEPHDVDALAAAMRRVLTDPDLAADLRARGLARSQLYSWERTTRETLDVYERLLT